MSSTSIILKGAIKFFKDISIIKDYLNDYKQYKISCEVEFIGQDYNDSLDIPQVDLIISQYAGFVGQATKEYLKIGGILLCNDSHGDATLARFDDDFEFIGVITKNLKIKKMNLDRYFILPKNKVVNLNLVKKTMKGPKYIEDVENYLFRKLK